MKYTVTVEPGHHVLSAEAGITVMQLLQESGIHLDAPCGGKGSCGKCRVFVNGEEMLACTTKIENDLEVRIPEKSSERILTKTKSSESAVDGTDDYVLAIDIGTTTLVAFLLNGHTGEILATASALNPQTDYGADVISRIQYVMEKKNDDMKLAVRGALKKLTLEASKAAGIAPEQITCAAVVGNTAMHHLFLGIDPTPLITPPYMPGVREAMELKPEGILPISPDGVIRMLPNIAGFVGADTVGCILACSYDTLEDLTLMIDIGTNGEMVLGNKHRRIACSTAAGPAFEGAKIRYGMRGAAGAIDRVSVKDHRPVCSVIGGGKAVGICGSGLLDAVAAGLDEEWITETGRMAATDDPTLWTKVDTFKSVILKDEVALTQKDVREVQLAKAAIRAGIELMCKRMNCHTSDIRKVYLAGAFGNYLRPASACRIGMIPPELLDRIEPVGNAAGEGAKHAVLSRKEYDRAKKLAAETEFLELASMKEFQDCYVDHMTFEEDDDD